VATAPAPRHCRLIPVALLVALTVCPACGAGPDLDKELATARSWTSTAHLAVDLRRTGATTATYTKQLHDRAATTLDDERKTLAEAAHTPGDRARARAALDSLALAVRQLDEASRP
jgi:hypothetical protein